VIIGRHFQDGSEVKKGDLLFTVDPRPFQAVLDQAKAQAALDAATFKRQEDLRARKVIAQQDYDIASANAQKSQAATESAQVNLDYCFIKSPINGTHLHGFHRGRERSSARAKVSRRSEC